MSYVCNFGMDRRNIFVFRLSYGSWLLWMRCMRFTTFHFHHHLNWMWSAAASTIESEREKKQTHTRAQDTPQVNSKRKGLFMHKEKRIFIPFFFFFIAIVPLFMIYNSNSTNLFIGFFVDENQHFGWLVNVNLRAWKIPIQIVGRLFYLQCKQAQRFILWQFIISRAYFSS